MGRLVDQPDPASVSALLQELLLQPADRGAIRRFAEQHSWDRVADGMQEVFSGVQQARPADAGRPVLSRKQAT